MSGSRPTLVTRMAVLGSVKVAFESEIRLTSTATDIHFPRERAPPIPRSPSTATNTLYRPMSAPFFSEMMCSRTWPNALTELWSNDRWDLLTLEAWMPSWLEAWMYSSDTIKSPGWGTQETNPIYVSRSSDDSGPPLKIDILLLAPRLQLTRILERRSLLSACPSFITRILYFNSVVWGLGIDRASHTLYIRSR